MPVPVDDDTPVIEGYAVLIWHFNGGTIADRFSKTAVENVRKKGK
jgi:hypothetical protein